MDRKHFPSIECECSICGKISMCEMHHKIPLSLGGTNEKSNIIPLCYDCHVELHKSNRGQMVKAGMNQALKDKSNFSELVSREECLALFIEWCVINDEFRIPIDEAIELISKAECRNVAKASKRRFVDQVVQRLDNARIKFSECYGD